MTMKKSLFAALVAGTAVAMTANSASAFFGHHRGGSCGSWGGGSGGSWGGGSWGGGSGGSWGGGSRGSWGGGSYGGGSCGSYGGGYSSVYYGYYGGYATVSRPVTTIVAKSAPAVKTQLTLRVPAEAKVTLAGVETKQTGEVRQFTTSRLASGEIWNDYKVVIELNRDGQTVREERVISLTGGQNQDLAVNFDSNKTEQIAQLTSK